MDIAPTSTNIPTPKSPEPETETPTRIHQPSKPLTFTNGVLKRHNSGGGHHHHHHNNHPVVVSYKECLKNHAATLGGHALDGCGEFMSSPTSNPSDPTSLKCAACGCHRNFHRREPDDSQALQITGAATAMEYQPHHRHHPPPPPPLANRSPNSSSPPPISSSYYPSSAPHMLLALSGSHPDNNNNNTPNNHHHHHHSNNHHHHHQSSNLNLTPGAVISSLSNQNPNSRKRFRTKFSQYQKDKMLQFAERVGWKMQKRDEDLVHSFCNDVGVDKNVFKVWMHNNKNHFVGKTDHSSINGARSGNLGGDDNSENHDTDENNGGDNNNTTSNNGGQNLNHHHQQQQQQQNQHHGFDDNNDVAHVGTNGSSSSS